MKLHLGCFDQPIDGWVNTDITPHILLARIPLLAGVLGRLGLLSSRRVDQHKAGLFSKVRYLDVTKRFPFPDDSVECAFCSHVLEHLHPRVVPGFFSEVRRVLRPRGIFRVAVPDLEWALSLYRKDDPTAFLQAVFEHSSKGHKNHHKWMYTSDSLAHTFQLHGFTDVRVCGFREGRLPEVEIVDNRPENSIYAEGVKPAGCMEEL